MIDRLTVGREGMLVSYDVQVYAPRQLSHDEIRALLVAASLEFEEIGALGGFMVFRGTGRQYSFTLEPVVAVEPEDVPEEVTAAATGLSQLYQLLVEGSSPTEIPHAVKFARRLAQDSDGVVFDQQTEQVWSRGQSRRAPRVEKGTVSVIQIRWYTVVYGVDPANIARMWLALARRYLPEARPGRYDTVEPMQHRLGARDDDFVDFVHDRRKGFFLCCNPVAEGSISCGSAYSGRIVANCLTVFAAPFADGGWQAGLRNFFCNFAEESGAVLATAEVVRGVRWSGRRLGYGLDTEDSVYLAGGEWHGLPPYPLWWMWFGPHYVPLVEGHLAPDTVERRGGALFHWRSDTPADRDTLTAALPPAPASRWLPGRLRRNRHQPWLPPELLLTVDNSNPRVFPRPVTAARVIPDALGKTEPI